MPRTISEKQLLSRKLSQLMRISPEKRAKSYRQWLMHQPNKARLIALRQEGTVNRKKAFEGLKNTVAKMQSTHPLFKGILLIGSYARGKRVPNDIDFLPVLQTPFTELPRGNEGGYNVDKFFEEFTKATGKPCHTGTGHEFYISSKDTRNLKKSIDFFTQFNIPLRALREWNFIGDPATKAIIAKAIQKAKSTQKKIEY
jgi:hypothetical protein